MKSDNAITAAAGTIVIVMIGELFVATFNTFAVQIYLLAVVGAGVSAWQAVKGLLNDERVRGMRAWVYVAILPMAAYVVVLAYDRAAHTKFF